MSNGEGDTAAGDRKTVSEVETVEWFDLDSSPTWLLRHVRCHDGSVSSSRVPRAAEPRSEDVAEASAYDAAWLQAQELPEPLHRGPAVRIADLFCGCGGMTLGVAEAARALERDVTVQFAADTDEAAREVYAANFDFEPESRGIDELFGCEEGEAYEPRHEKIAAQIGDVDVLLGGPPCQGHSNLNNHSRRTDAKNVLFFSMARAAELLDPDHIIIENVRDIVHDQDRVFQRTRRYLRETLDYSVDSLVVRAERLGVPQRRHRMFLVASRSYDVSIEDLIEPFNTDLRTFEWACGGLSASIGEGHYDSASRPAQKTKERIDWLFDNDKYDLPNDLRPPCHQNGKHTYKSVYGRIRPDQPVQTITTGFTYMGQGRFVHPKEARTISPHEAARLQFLPDSFRFGLLNRSDYKNLIGNAVPPKLTYVIALQLLR